MSLEIPEAQRKVEEARELLGELIDRKGLTRQDVDDRLGLPRGTTRNVLARRKQLTLGSIVGILKVLQVPLDQFFLGLRERERLAASDVAATLAALGHEPLPAAPARVEVDLGELRRLIAEAVDEAMRAHQRQAR